MIISGDMNKLVTLVFSAFNFSIVVYAMFFFLLYEEKITEPFSLVLLFSVSACLVINILHLAHSIAGVFTAYRQSRHKKNYYNTETLQRNILVEKTLQMK